MGASHSRRERFANSLLRRPVRARTGDDEQLLSLLTNKNIGVTYRAAETITIEPARDHGAVAAATDTGILFLIGDPDEYDGDFVEKVSLEAIESIEKEAAGLSQSLLVRTTDGREWEFTARRASTVDDFVDAVDGQLAERALAVAREYHAEAKATGDPADRARNLEAALEAYREAAERLGDDRSRVSDAEHEAREDAEAVIRRLIASHRDHGAVSSSAAEWELDAGNETEAYDLFEASRDAYDRALELARKYPPGDPDTIECERAAVDDAMDSLQIEFAVPEAADV